jgi:GxxExxY protein
MVAITNRHEEIATRIVNSAFNIHKAIGPGLLERIYEVCMVHELNKQGLKVTRQVAIPIIYDGIMFNEGYRIDILVEDLIILELKAAEQMNALWEAQILSYLKMMNLHLGFLINFNVPVIKHGIHRYII